MRLTNVFHRQTGGFIDGCFPAADGGSSWTGGCSSKAGEVLLRLTEAFLRCHLRATLLLRFGFMEPNAPMTTAYKVSYSTQALPRN